MCLNMYTPSVFDNQNVQWEWITSYGMHVVHIRITTTHWIAIVQLNINKH